MLTSPQLKLTGIIQDLQGLGMLLSEIFQKMEEQQWNQVRNQRLEQLKQLVQHQSSDPAKEEQALEDPGAQ